MLVRYTTGPPILTSTVRAPTEQAPPAETIVGASIPAVNTKPTAPPYADCPPSSTIVWPVT
jgi:hypothetical protein